MFGFGKEEASPGLSSSLIRHLNEVDELYMHAYGIKTTHALYPYLSVECVQVVNRYVFQLGGRYFGSPKFRDTEWTLLEQAGSILTLLKEVTFDKVRVGRAVSVAVADNYSEEWTVDVSDKSKPMVTMIKGR